ncbi:MAG TPA: acylphosphatase [Vicinamibacterales bacterium]|nr:acylphosphatase [Vicinamibacterales bacterium]
MIGGRVQGVGFRFFAEHHARLEGIGGWVRNLADGRVEVVAEGDEAALDRFERALRRGPRGAIVETVEVEALAPTGHRDFTIRY